MAHLCPKAQQEYFERHSQGHLHVTIIGGFDIVMNKLMRQHLINETVLDFNWTGKVGSTCAFRIAVR